MDTREAIVLAGDWGPSRNNIAMKLHYKYFFLRADGKWVACLGDTKSVEQLVSLRSKGVEVSDRYQNRKLLQEFLNTQHFHTTYHVQIGPCRDDCIVAV